MGYKILVLLTFALVACKTETKEIPDFLSKEQMISVLVDIHILEGKVEKMSISKDSGSLIFNTFEPEIFEEHGISKEDYLKSYKYYLEEVVPMNEIYNAVVDSLNYMQKSYDAKIKKEKEEEKEKLKISQEKLK